MPVFDIYFYDDTGEHTNIITHRVHSYKVTYGGEDSVPSFNRILQPNITESELYKNNTIVSSA